jgi:hypothetical protein
MSEPLIRETAAPPTQAEAPSTPPTEVTPISPSAPEEIVNAQFLREIFHFLKDKQGLKTAEEIYAACLKYRDASSVLQRATNLEDRIKRMLETDAPPAAPNDGTPVRRESPPPAPPLVAEAPAQPPTEIITAQALAAGVRSPIVKMIPIGSINLLDHEMQSRVEVSQATVDHYVELMEDGVKFPPIDVFYEDGVVLFHLPDGWHRCYAAIRVRERQGARVEDKAINALEIEATIRPGTRRDALWFALGANSKNPLNTSPADKRKMVTRILLDEEWSRNKSDCEISRHCGVSDRFVAKMRTELSPNRSEMRMVQRAGTTYPMSTAKIGKRPSSKTAATPKPPDSPQESVLSDLKVASAAMQHARKTVKQYCPVLTEKFESEIASIAKLQNETHVHEFSQPEPSASEAPSEDTAEAATAHG